MMRVLPTRDSKSTWQVTQTTTKHSQDKVTNKNPNQSEQNPNQNELAHCLPCSRGPLSWAASRVSPWLHNQSGRRNKKSNARQTQIQAPTRTSHTIRMYTTYAATPLPPSPRAQFALSPAWHTPPRQRYADSWRPQTPRHHAGPSSSAVFSSFLDEWLVDHSKQTTTNRTTFLFGNTRV